MGAILWEVPRGIGLRGRRGEGGGGGEGGEGGGGGRGRLAGRKIILEDTGGDRDGRVSV